jgi:DNA-binding NtrC family response regulator
MTTALNKKGGSLAVRARVLVVSGSKPDSLPEAVARSEHEASHCATWDEFTAANAESPCDLVVCDAEAAAAVPANVHAPIVGLDELQRVGFDALSLLLPLARSLHEVQARCAELDAAVAGIRSGAALVGKTPVARRLLGAVGRAADCDATVLVDGQPGSGKSLVARMIHLKSRRGDRGLVAVDCASVTPEQLQRSIESAQGSTIVLENVDQLPTPTQAALVKHLKERSPARMATLPRLVATTSAHLPELVARGGFREDLFYRLHALPVHVPALRERPDDVLPIAEHLLDVNAAQTGRANNGFTETARALLEGANWSGNVRQLESVVRRAQALAGGSAIDRQHLAAAVDSSPTQAVESTRPAAAHDDANVGEEDIRPFEQEEQILLGRALRATKGNVRRAAQLLGIGRATLYRKIQQYDLRMH